MVRRLLTILSVTMVFLGAVPAAAGTPDQETKLWIEMVDDEITGQDFAFVYGQFDGVMVGDSALRSVFVPRPLLGDWDGDAAYAKPLRVRMTFLHDPEVQIDFVMRGIDMEWTIGPYDEHDQDVLCAVGTVRWRIKNPRPLQEQLVELGYRKIKIRGQGGLGLCLTPEDGELRTSAEFSTELHFRDPRMS